MPSVADKLLKKHTLGLDASFGITQPIYRTELVPKLASSPGEDRDSPPTKRKKQSPQEQDYLDGLLDAAANIVRPPLSAIGYLGSSGLDAVAGRRVRAGIALLTGQGQDKNRVSELFTVPFISDMVGWTDRQGQVTGSDLLGGWDDPDTIADGVAEFAVEVITDPLTFLPGAILGAANKGGRIVKSAGYMDDVTRGLSQKLRRRVGRSEARVLTSLKDAVTMSYQPTKTAPTMSAKLKAKWDAAAIGQGYKDIDDALANVGDKMLGGRIGATWNPIGDAIETFGTGPMSQKYLRGVDKLGHGIAYSPIGTKVAGLFDSSVRDALTPQGQEALRQATSKIDDEQFNIRMRTNERLATLSAHGLDKPQYRDAVIGMVEGSVRHGRRNPEKIYEIAASDRKIDKIVRDNLRRAKHPEAKTYKQWTGYEPMKELIKDLHDELAGEVVEHEMLGLGDKKLSEIMENYLTRSTKDIGNPEVFRYKPPKAITRDIERRLNKQGLSHQEIHSMSAEDAAEKAGYKWKEAEDLVIEQQKKGQFAGPRGALGKTTQNYDTSMIRRKEFIKGVTGGASLPGGTEAINLLAMDSRLSGPLADYARNHDVAAKIIFSEYMGNNPKLFKMMNNNGTYKMGDKFGDLAGLHPHALGKKVDDVMDEVDAEILNDSFEAMYSARLSSEELAGYLRELDPRYAQHQIPLFFDDMPSRYMKGRLGARNTFEMAKAAHRMLRAGMSEDLVRGQSLSVLSALREAGFEKRAGKRLAAFLRVNGLGPGLVGSKNKYHMLAKPGDTVVSVTVRGKKYKLNSDWVSHEQARANEMFSYGASAGRSASRKGIRPILERLKADALTDVRVKIRKKIKLGTATPKMQALAKRKFKGLRLPEKKLAELTQRATRQGSKLKGDTLRGVLRAKFYNQFIKSGGKVKRVSNDVINDARKSMDLASDPDVTRGFLGVWDKLTNTIKSKLTGEHIPYFLRNMQGLAIMDYVFGAQTSKGIVDFLNPKRAYRFYKRWQKMVDFHAGEDIKGAHKLPYFAKTDWKNIAAEKEKLTGVKHVVDDKFKDAVATDHMRALAMASEVAPPHRSSEVLADRLGIPVAEFSTVGELIPGIGRNKVSRVGLKEGAKRAAKAVKRVAGKAKDLATRKISPRDIDWSFLNPLEVRGGFMKKSREMGSSQFLLTKVGEWANDYGDRIGRTATWYGLMEEGVDPVQAALRSNAMHVDYNKLSSFEKKVARRWVPFYTFQRKMLSYFMRDLAQHPGGPTANLIRAINVSTGEGRETNFVPQQLAGQLAVPLYRNGTAQAYLKPDLPIEVLNDMFTISPDAYTTFQNTTLGWAGQLHFIPKAMTELAFGKSTFQKGRRLEDMYSRIGSKDPILNQIVMASPLSRYISMYGPRGTLFDERKTALEKASSLVAGVPIATIDMEKAAREGIRDAINKEVRTEDGVAITERYYIADGDQASDRAKELIDLQNSLAKRQRALKKKLAADAERNEQKRVAPPAF